MVERVARAICATSCVFAKCHSRPCEDWTLHEDEARTAIQAMREPTRVMIEAAWSKDAATNWRAMIDAAALDQS